MEFSERTRATVTLPWSILADFLLLAGGELALIGGAATWPLLAAAQQPGRPLFGILLVFSQEAGRTFTEPLRAYMRALGHFEGRNIAFVPTLRHFLLRIVP